MTTRKLNLMVKITLCVLLALCVTLTGCKKASDEDSATKAETTKKTTDAAKQQAQQTPEKEQAKAGESEMIPVNIELPKKMFVGTPTNINVEKLEKASTDPRPPFLAPKGVTNVALNKPISSTDEEPIIGEIAMITDGDKSGADGSYVELGPFKQYVTIDLGQMQEIYAIVLWHFHKQARVYFDVAVQVADDPDFITNVRTLFNNDHDNSLGLGAGEDMHYVESNEGKLIDAKGAKAQYVRLYSNGNTSNELNHYIEVEVYGKPAK